METQVLGTATLSSRGQITIPKEIRDALFLTEGARIEFRLQGGEVVIAEALSSADRLRHGLGSFLWTRAQLTRSL